MTAVLTADQVSIAFGGLKALTDFSLALEPKELVGLIGPNGAGKTTAFNVLTGVYAPTSGFVRVGERVVNGLRPSKIAGLGLTRTFQNIRLFKELTVLDNVRIACHHKSKASWLHAVARTKTFAKDEEQMRERAQAMLAALGLGHRRDELAKNLPYGEQRRLEIARGLATEPRCVLLDEPAAGMNSKEKIDLMHLIHELRERFSVAILLIEHDMQLVMGICERIVVLDHGVEISRGKPEEVRRDPKVIEAYLGTTHG